MLHMYLFPNKTSNNISLGNVIIFRKPCPVKGGPHVKKQGEMFGESSLYYHWDKHHRKDVGLSVGKYIAKMNGKEIIICPQCCKGFNNRRCLTRHRYNCQGKPLNFCSKKICK